MSLNLTHDDTTSTVDFDVSEGTDVDAGKRISVYERKDAPIRAIFFVTKCSSNIKGIDKYSEMFILYQDLMISDAVDGSEQFAMDESIYFIVKNGCAFCYRGPTECDLIHGKKFLIKEIGRIHLMVEIHDSDPFAMDTRHLVTVFENMYRQDRKSVLGCIDMF